MPLIREIRDREAPFSKSTPRQLKKPRTKLCVDDDNHGDDLCSLPASRQHQHHHIEEENILGIPGTKPYCLDWHCERYIINLTDSRNKRRQPATDDAKTPVAALPFHSPARTTHHLMIPLSHSHLCLCQFRFRRAPLADT